MPKGIFKFRAFLSCGKCGATCGVYEFPKNATTATAMKAYMRKNGWSITRKHGWVCPTCNYEKNKKLLTARENKDA